MKTNQITNLLPFGVSKEAELSPRSLGSSSRWYYISDCFTARANSSQSNTSISNSGSTSSYGGYSSSSISQHTHTFDTAWTYDETYHRRDP